MESIEYTGPMFYRRMSYNPATRLYELYLDGKLVGTTRTEKAGKRRLDQLVYEGIRAELRKMIPGIDLITIY